MYKIKIPEKINKLSKENQEIFLKDIQSTIKERLELFIKMSK